MKDICRAMKNLVSLTILFAVITITFSCTPQKRLSRLIALHPELTITDTIKINDTVITTQTRIDTSFHNSTIKDTISIEKEKLKLQIVEILDTIYIEVEHEADTIIIERKIPVERIVVQEDNEDKIQRLDDLLNRRWFWVVVGVAITGLLIFLLKK
jgi:hypothetical protein